MDASIVARVTIAAEPDEVFKYLADLKYHELWNPQLRSLSSEGKLKLGSKYETESEVMGIPIEARNVVTKFVPNKELELENNTGSVMYRINFNLTYKPLGHTLVILTAHLITQSKIIGLTVPVLERLAKYELKMDLEALKIAVEGKLE